MADIEVDALVVGGGPGGLRAAGRLAADGHRVLVCEEHETIGDPVHCTGIVSAESIDELDLPREATLNALDSVEFFSPAGLSIRYTTPRPQAIVIDRGAFDRALATRARAAGARLLMSTRVRGLTIDARGATAFAGDRLVRARLVVLACGATYGVQRDNGLGLPAHYLHTAQRELPAERLRHVEVQFGRDVAPSGFAWAVPVRRPTGTFVRVGVMTASDAPCYFDRMLRRVAGPWGVDTANAAPRLKILPLGAIAKTYATRLLAVGDAAGLVKPTTGGGIYYSVLSATIAGEVGSSALTRDTLDAGALSAYETKWRSRLAREFEAQHALRRAATAMTDADIDALFDLAQTDGVMPLVRKTARFNEHRHLIRALFNHRPARRILFRSIAG